MKIEWIKTKKHEHEYEGYMLTSLGTSFEIWKIRFILSEPKEDRIVDKCKICDKIKAINKE